MSSIGQDIRYGIRTLLDRPSFTLIAVVSLALGIGVNSTIFSIINATLLAPIGFEDEDRIVAISTYPLDFPDGRSSATYREYVAWKDSRSFGSVGALLTGVKNLGAESDRAPAEELQVIRSTPDMFRVLGIQPQLGRLFTPEEDRVDDWAAVALITDRFWERRFGRDPAAVGQTLRLDGAPATVIGVLPPGVEEDLFLPTAALWVPSEIVTAQSISDGRFLITFARLADEVSLAQANDELGRMAPGFAEEYPNSNENMGFRVTSLHDFFYQGAEEQLMILQGAVLFVLLIACANVAGMMLARATARQNEIAIRSSVGAVRGRLVRQVLTESLVLSAAGGVFGVLLAWIGLRWFVSAAPADVPNLDMMTVNPSVLAFTTAVVGLTAVLFGIIPAIQGTRPDLTSLLNDSARGSSGGVARQKLRLAMVTMQTGVALVLLITAGLLINSFLQLQDNELGADPDGVLTFRLQFAQDETITFTGQQVDGVGLWDVNPQVGLTIDRIHDELRFVPGIEAAAVNAPPFQGAAGRTIRVDGPSVRDDVAESDAAYLAITPGYFEILKVGVQRGRPFSDLDGANAPPVAIVNEAMAQQYWEDANPIGSTVTMDFVPGEPAREIVGVVSNILLSQYAETATPVMYVPYSQQTDTWLGPQWGQRAGVYFMVRGQGSPTDLVPVIQSSVARVDPDRPLTQIRTIEQYLGEQMQGNVLWVSLLGTFGIIAGLLAVTGIYGVVSYSVAQRTHEIGIRMALGATGKKIITLIMRQAVVVVAIGLVIGILGSLLLTPLIAGTLFGVGATDPVTFAAVSLLLVAAALIACLVPTWRALKVDPTDALRY